MLPLSTLSTFTSSSSRTDEYTADHERSIRDVEQNNMTSGPGAGEVDRLSMSKVSNISYASRFPLSVKNHVGDCNPTNQSHRNKKGPNMKSAPLRHAVKNGDTWKPVRNNNSSDDPCRKISGRKTMYL